jgi:hypothetical protein
MGSAQIADGGVQYRSYQRSELGFRPVASTVYTPGMCVKLASMDLQVFTDAKAIALTGTTANQQLIRGIVSETWNGFNATIGAANYTSGANLSALLMPLPLIDVVVAGFHPAVFVDQSGAGAVTLVNELPLIPSRATAGYSQGIAAASAPGGTGFVGNALLPASGIGSSITAAALAQASQTDTIAGVPLAGDTLTVTIQSPYVASAPGTAQTLAYTITLTSAQAASVTLAAAALVAFLNAQASFNQYFTATNLAGVVTVTVNGLATPFRVNFGTGANVASSFDISLSGMIANSLTFAVAATGGSTATAGGANFAGGTGFKGTIPAVIAAAVL